MSKFNLPAGESLNVKNAFRVVVNGNVCVFHYYTLVAFKNLESGKIFVYNDKMSQSSIKAVREVFDLERDKKGFYTYYNNVTSQTERAELISSVE